MVARFQVFQRCQQPQAHVHQAVVRTAGQFDAAGGRLLVMDGAAIMLQDSNANHAVYHYASGQKPGCGFPQMHLLGLFDLRTRAWLRVVKSAARRHDSFLAWKLLGFLRRWDVELFFDDIKTSQRMDMLRCKSPAMVARELLMHIIAYNLVRVLLVQAEGLRPAGQEGRLSFKGTLDRLHHWHSALWGNPSRQAVAKCHTQMLEDIANDVVLPRPGRYETQAGQTTTRLLLAADPSKGGNAPRPRSTKTSSQGRVRC